MGSKCKICGCDLGVYGSDYKGRPCPDCLNGIKETLIKCAGKCGNRYQKQHMSRIAINWEPGVKGGKKTILFYCRQCAVAASSKAIMIQDSQGEAIETTMARLQRNQGG